MLIYYLGSKYLATLNEAGVDVKNKYYIRVTILLWNNASRLDVASHVTSFNQSECKISLKSNYSNLKFVHDIDSWCTSDANTGIRFATHVWERIKGAINFEHMLVPK